MQIKCPNCGAECEAECELTVGQHVICPYCQYKFAYLGFVQRIAPLLFKAKKAATAVKDKVLTIWRNSKDGRYAFVAKVKMTANVVRNKTVSLWKSGWNGKVILCVAALLALWLIWPSGKGEMTVEEGAPLPLRLALRAIQPSSSTLREEEFAHVRLVPRCRVDVERPGEFPGGIYASHRQRLHDGLVELAHPKRALGLAAEARLSGYDKPPYAAFGAVVVGWDVRFPRPVVHPVRMFPEDVLHVLKRRVFRASVRQSDYLRLDGLGLAGESLGRKVF